ncbi:MAG: ribonuclease III [Kiritimatiellia bacterium]
MKTKYKLLEKAIGYRFRHKEILDTALTHRSFRYENGDVHVDNERLEFLGDAVLSSVSAAWLFNQFPDEQEGRLSMLKSAITNTKALARIGDKLELGSYLQLGRGEMLSGGHERCSNVANAVEAIMGAAYIDGGIKAVRKIFSALFLDELDLVLHQKYINPKGILQQYAQKYERCSPASKCA